MTSVAPVQCLACSRLDRTTTDGLGTVIPTRCLAYPDRIPAEIAMFGDDHRTARGDEVEGLTYVQEPDPDAETRFNAWLAFTAAGDSPA